MQEYKEYRKHYIYKKKGFNVTIFDRDNPGAQAASYGNAGHFSPYASVPLNRPDVLADVPSMLLNSSVRKI